MKKLLGIIILSTVSFGSYSQEESGYRKFALKFSPTQLVAGEFNFSYEQRLAKIISLELEIGPTISQFGLNMGNQKLWQGDLGLGNYKPIDPDAEASIGFHVSLAPRFYPAATEDNPMKGLYLSPVFKYRKYNYINEDQMEVLDNTKSSLSQMIFRFNMGLQFWPGDGNFSLDMYFGIGLGTYEIKGQRIEPYDAGSGVWATRWVGYQDNGIRFNVATGIKFGFGK